MKYSRLFIGAVLMASAAFANAANISNTYTINLSAQDGFYSGGFNNTFKSDQRYQTFLDSYSFTLSTESDLDALVSSLATIRILKGTPLAQLDLDITTFSLYLGEDEIAKGSPMNSGILDLQLVSTLGLAKGDYSLKIGGQVLGEKGGSYSGNVNVIPVAPVPEPESWGMIASGMAAVGVLSRRRKLKAKKSELTAA